jgi:chemotaxis signal transduction protein
MSSARGRAVPTRRGEPMILFAVGANTFAIAAAEVDEIRDLHDITPKLAALGHTSVKSKLHRSNRDYIIVDSAAHFQIPPSKPARLLVLRNHPFAITADSIDRMADVSLVRQLPSAFRGLERNWYKGLAVLDGTVIPVVNPAAFLSGAEIAEIRKNGAAS